RPRAGRRDDGARGSPRWPDDARLVRRARPLHVVGLPDGGDRSPRHQDHRRGSRADRPSRPRPGAWAVADRRTVRQEQLGPLSLPTTGTPPQIRDTAPFDFEAALATGMRTGQGDEWLELGHVKFFTDGALGSQTAALEEPYEGTQDRGILTFDPIELRTDVARAAAGGLAVAIHAIGDRAAHVALDAVAPTRITSPALRQRLEHVQLVRDEDLGRFGALGVIASMQPIHCTSDRDLADRYWGPKRTPRAYPWRTLLEHGAVLAFGSDAPVEPIDPLLGIHAAVARRRPG